MHDDTSGSHERNPDTPPTESGTSLTGRGRSQMRARTWTIAAQYADPVEYGIPTLPDWTVYTLDSRGMALAESDGTEPFIRAEQPMTVRR